MFFTDHLYFSGALLLVVVAWLPLFIFNKDGRKWMLYMSLWGVLMSFPFVQSMYIADWWQPNFIFDFPIKIEDLLFGLGTVGIISSVYSLLKSKDKRLSQIKISVEYKLIALAAAFSAFFGLFYVFHVHSFWTSVIGVSVGVAFVAIQKPIFLRYATLTAILISAYILPLYLLALYIDPTFVADEWLLDHLSGLTLLSIPIEEFVWYVLEVFGVAGLQELLE